MGSLAIFGAGLVHFRLIFKVRCEGFVGNFRLIFTVHCEGFVRYFALIFRARLRFVT
jgi:hypothetical protein